MSHPYRAVALLVSVLTCSAPAFADEVRLLDGRALYGAVEVRGGTVVVETRDGTVTVARAEVQRIRTDAELRAELAGLAGRCQPDSAFCCLHLAHVARDFGLDRELWVYLDRALSQDQIPASVAERLDAFLASLEPELLPLKWRRMSPAVRARELVLRLRADSPRSLLDATVRVLADLPGAETELRTRARSATLPVQRATATAAVWATGTDEARRFVYRTAVFDEAAEVRTRTTDLLRAAGAAEAGTEYLAPALVHDHPKVRMRAADALASLAAPRAAELIVKAAPYAAVAGDHGGVRAHAAFLTQQSYIKDFDVEVAQASFIADPKVDALTYGSVIDVRVGAVTTSRIVIVEAFRRALARLEGDDPGADPETWEKWLASRRNS